MTQLDARRSDRHIFLVDNPVGVSLITIAYHLTVSDNKTSASKEDN